MKYMLSLLLMTFPLSTPHQAVIFNTPTEYIYVVDFNQNPIEILSIHKNTYLPITCLNTQPKQLKQVNFSSAPSCLVQSLNQTFHLNIKNTIDMKNAFSSDQIKQIAKEKKMSQLFSLIQKTSTSYSYFQLYDIYNEAKKNNFKYQFLYPTYLAIDQFFIPLNR